MKKVLILIMSLFAVASMSLQVIAFSMPSDNYCSSGGEKVYQVCFCDNGSNGMCVPTGRVSSLGTLLWNCNCDDSDLNKQALQIIANSPYLNPMPNHIDLWKQVSMRMKQDRYYDLAPYVEYQVRINESKGS